jgi:UDP-glucuronate decarboxylase
MKRILVTGGSGFIGSNLCERLVKDKNNYVICVDNFYSSTPKNIYELKKKFNFEFIRHDVTFPLYVEVDEIYHLACPASPIYYQRDPIQTTKTSVHGSINMLGLAKRTKSKIILASTSEVYGDPIVHPQTEQYWGNVNPIGIRSCYDEGKRCAESLFMDYNRQHNLDSKIVRIFNTYGPKMAINDGRVVSNFINQALTGKNITIYGEGSQTRSFQYIDDLINALLAMMNSNQTGPINLGNPEELTVLQLAETILSMISSNSKLVFSDLPSDDPRQRKPNIEKAENLLNWTPKVPLHIGLQRTIDYFKSNYGEIF